MARLPHDRHSAGSLENLGQCLTALHIEDELLARAMLGEHIESVQ